MKNLSPILFAVSLISAPLYSFDKPINTAVADQPEYVQTINYAKPTNKNDYIQVYNGPVTYEEIKHYAMRDCRFNPDPSEELVDALIDIEKTYAPPPSMRGMLLAAACMESGFRTDAKGDRRFSKNKRTPMAIGILQQWPFYEKAYGTVRTNPHSAATTWMQHIVKQIPKVKKQCRYKTEHRIWLASWVTGIRYKKAEGRCKERPKHYRLLRKWQRQIEKDRKLQQRCDEHEECGC
jgi:hypothetical protein